jgi:hypothetical protein
MNNKGQNGDLLIVGKCMLVLLVLIFIVWGLVLYTDLILEKNGNCCKKNSAYITPSCKEPTICSKDYIEAFSEGYDSCSVSCRDYISSNSCETCEFYKCKN